MGLDVGNFDLGNFNTVPNPIYRMEDLEEFKIPSNPITYMGRTLVPTERGFALGDPYCINLKTSGDQLESILIYGPSGTGKTFVLYILFEIITMLTAEPIFWVDRKAEWYGWGHPKLPFKGMDSYEWRLMERFHPEFLTFFSSIGKIKPTNIIEDFVDSFTCFFNPKNVIVFFPPYATLEKEDLKQISEITGYRCKFFKPSWKLLTPTAAANLFSFNIKARYMEVYERAFFEARKEAENYSEFIATLMDFIEQETVAKEYRILASLLGSDECFKWFEYSGENMLLEAFEKPGQIYVLSFMGFPQVPKNAAWVELWIESAVSAVRLTGKQATVAIDDLPWYRIENIDILSALKKLIHVESRIPGVGMRKILVTQTTRQLPRDISPATNCYTHIISTKPSYGFSWKTHPQYECEVKDIILDKEYRLTLRPPLNKKLRLPREALPIR